MDTLERETQPRELLASLLDTQGAAEALHEAEELRVEVTALCEKEQRLRDAALAEARAEAQAAAELAATRSRSGGGSSKAKQRGRRSRGGKRRGTTTEQAGAQGGGGDGADRSADAIADLPGDRMEAVSEEMEGEKEEERECAICLLSPGDLRVLSCGHVFDEVCLDRWARACSIRDH